MYTPAHRGSARAAGLVRRYTIEYGKAQSFVSERQSILDSITVIQPTPTGAEGEEVEEITVADVIEGRVKARIRRGGSFASVKKVQEELSFWTGELCEARDIMADCEANLRRLIGAGEARKLINKKIRAAFPPDDK